MVNLSDDIIKQKEFFKTHKTKDLNFRIDALKKLKSTIIEYESKICDALYKDLHKSEFESYASEIGMVLEELHLHIKNLKKWAKPKGINTPLINFKASSKIHSEPFGNVLIIAPWNYPFQLIMMPLIGAISAGNCATLKPSEFTPHSAELIKEIIEICFPPEYVNIFTGEKEVNIALLKERWDYIFFTGSPRVGKIVMKAAAENLTPVTLELGGKSPVIVDKDAKLNIAAKRIIWGKMLNAGQICIAPDYMFVHKDVKDELLSKMKEVILEFYGENPKESNSYPRICTKENVSRLAKLIENEEIFHGGDFDEETRYFSPTIINNVSPESAIMQEEIFGSILPVMEFENIDNVINFINEREKPLALYYFSESSKNQKYILSKTTSGGVCINDVLMQLVNQDMPFGGVGNSGMGYYHGKYSFDTFSHKRSVLYKSTLIDVPIRYAPYSKKKLNLLKKVLK